MNRPVMNPAYGNPFVTAADAGAVDRALFSDVMLLLWYVLRILLLRSRN
ncbi:hypothetical protein OpiT1DRAFT_03824 [Opitutaceae bacterium TAV1]|nr:hypothetical protein OpiT1DRAFT_03824 [Opitutaceae bacterium TAV1]